jgi:hypothetical protein
MCTHHRQCVLLLLLLSGCVSPVHRADPFLRQSVWVNVQRQLPPLRALLSVALHPLINFFGGSGAVARKR